MDFYIFQLINGLAGRLWSLDWFAVFFADYSGYFLILIVPILFLREKNWRKRIYFFSLAVLSLILSRGIITEIIRFFYERPRPFLTLGFQPLANHIQNGSFPSGHASFFFALALSIFYFNKLWGWRFLAMATVISLARVFTGVHWPSDILAGAVIGLGSVFLIKRILPPLEKSPSEKEAPQQQVEA
ncbi:phosphatase PAP2 family protein [Candidatus Wolfebacteria bacterium]|nr:phosphatase PAP2 family protein [Candidatus Wolfebacteria bacterium]